MKIPKIGRPESNIIKITQKSQNMGIGCQSTDVFFSNEQCLHKQSSVFFQHYFFQKLQIDHQKHKLPIESKAIYSYTSSHCATSPPFFPSTESAAIFFVATPSQTDGLVFTIGGLAPLVRLWVPGLPKQIPQVSKRNSLELQRDWYGFFKVSSGVEWQQESP